MHRYYYFYFVPMTVLVKEGGKTDSTCSYEICILSTTIAFYDSPWKDRFAVEF